MTEQTHPETGVSQEQDPISRMSNLLASQPEGPAETEEAPEAGSSEQQSPEGPASDEVTPDDLEAEAEPVEQPAVDAFEIVRDGAQVKLTREEAIAYARQGFDYTRKTQALAEQKRLVDAAYQSLSQVDQVRPYLQQQEGQVRALEAQLQPYQNVDWVRLANEDPIAYSQQRANFDVLRDAYARANHEYQQANGAVKQQLDAADKQRRFAEMQRLPEFVPEWKDTAKRQADEAEIVKHYAQNYGVPPEELVKHLPSALAQAIVFKAMKYDKLLRAKGEKVKQLRTAPPVTKPGSASSGSAKADRAAEAMQRLRKTGSATDAMAAILNRMK